MKQKTITKNMLVGDVVKKHPEVVETMLENGMHCVGCHIATWETLEQAAQGHGIDINNLLKELNKKIKT